MQKCTVMHIDRRSAKMNEWWYIRITLNKQDTFVLQLSVYLSILPAFRTSLLEKPDVVVGTPSRVLAHLQKKVSHWASGGSCGPSFYYCSEWYCIVLAT